MRFTYQWWCVVSTNLILAWCFSADAITFSGSTGSTTAASPVLSSIILFFFLRRKNPKLMMNRVRLRSNEIEVGYQNGSQIRVVVLQTRNVEDLHRLLRSIVLLLRNTSCIIIIIYVWTSDLSISVYSNRIEPKQIRINFAAGHPVQL